jgi:hypothetical protein
MSMTVRSWAAHRQEQDSTKHRNKIQILRIDMGISPFQNVRKQRAAEKQNRSHAFGERQYALNNGTSLPEEN